MKTHERILEVLKTSPKSNGYYLEELARAAEVTTRTARKAVLHLDDFRLVQIRSGRYTVGRQTLVRLRATDKIFAK